MAAQNAHQDAHELLGMLLVAFPVGRIIARDQPSTQSTFAQLTWEKQDSFVAFLGHMCLSVYLYLTPNGGARLPGAALKTTTQGVNNDHNRL
jgi:cytochrome b561